MTTTLKRNTMTSSHNSPYFRVLRKTFRIDIQKEGNESGYEFKFGQKRLFIYTNRKTSNELILDVYSGSITKNLQKITDITIKKKRICDSVEYLLENSLVIFYHIFKTYIEIKTTPNGIMKEMLNKSYQDISKKFENIGFGYYIQRPIVLYYRLKKMLDIQDKIIEMVMNIMKTSQEKVIGTKYIEDYEDLVEVFLKLLF